MTERASLMPAGARDLSERLAASLSGLGWLVFAASLAALVIALPVLGLLASLAAGATEAWPHVRDTLLSDIVATSLILALGTGIGVTVFGVASAWLVTMCQFPGRRIFEWALILPLAVPAYVLAYVYTDFLQHAGPVQTALREWTGWGPREYWFPEIRSTGGAILIFSAAFYPYVYLLARAAFLQQSTAMLEASRSLGCGPWAGFRRVALPLARPAIVAGVALALMETLADFGAVAHFEVRTFTTVIYRVWFTMGDRMLAAQLASGLLLFVLMLLVLERWQRGQARYDDARAQYLTMTRYTLGPVQAGLAMLACAIPAVLGFALPFALLVHLTWTAGHDVTSARYISLTLNSVTLAGIAALLAVVLALIIAYAARLRPGRLTGGIMRLAGLGYAVPGTVIAVGVLIPLAQIDNSLDSFARDWFGVSTGLVFTGTIVALVYAYLVRFLSISLNAVDAGLTQVTPSMEAAARTLGQGPTGTLWRVHAPILKGGLLTAVLIVFVEVMKELPATLILRPFDFDTLAIQAYRLASDERLAEASTACLVIVAAGLIPILLLSRTIAASRPGMGPPAT